MNRLVVVVTLAVLTWACGGSPVSPTSPSASLAPTTPSAPASQLTYILSGVVFEVTPTGVMPIEGVQVEGFYRISGVSAGRIGVGFEKEGYQSSRSTVTVKRTSNGTALGASCPSCRAARRSRAPLAGEPPSA